MPDATIVLLDTDERIASYLNGAYMSCYAPCAVLPDHPFAGACNLQETGLPFMPVAALIDPACN